MSTTTATSGGGGVGGALSLMGCVREASPPPQNHHHHHHHHYHQQQQQQQYHHHQQQHHYQQHQYQQQQQDHRSLGDYSSSQNSVDPTPKEPKKRRFHPLRGLRKIFRRKSRGAADVRINSGSSEREAQLSRLPREDVTLRHPAGRPEEARSRSASELLTDSCDHESGHRLSFTGRRSKTYSLFASPKPRRFIKDVFLRRNGTAEDSFVKLRGGAAKLSVSHDSVFPGEVPHTRPLSSLDSLPTLERRQERKGNDIIEHKDYGQYVVQRHRISLRVLEQIKTVIENRNQLALATSSDVASTPVHSTAAVAITAGERYQQETTENRFSNTEQQEKNIDENQTKIVKPTKDVVEPIVPLPKEDLPELESASLNHTAALHRISVRPKNRRPPRRTTPQTVAASPSSSAITTIVEDSLNDEEEHGNEEDDLERQTALSNSDASSPMTLKSNNSGLVTRKSSSRLSRTSDIFEELESKLPKKSSSSVASLSPDSLDVANTSRTSVETSEEQPEIRSIVRKPSNRVSKGSDIFEELESKLPRRRSSSNRMSKSPDSLESSSCWFSKSSEGFDKLVEYEESKPIAMNGGNGRRSLNPISKSSDRVSKSSDSLEAIEALISDDSIERRRSSFEFRGRRSSSKVMSKSSENFEMLESSSTCVETLQELQKRSSVSDINLSRGRRLSKSASKSSESFEKIDAGEYKTEETIDDDEEFGKGYCRRSAKRMSSESSDNLELDDRLENRRIRRPPKRMSSTSVVDIVPVDDYEEERRPMIVRKSRLQKSSESSELGSTDTLDSERRNKSSESTETLDSLEKDIEQDRKDEETTDIVVDKREKNDSWSSRSMATTDSDLTSMADGTEDAKTLGSPEKFYWRQSSDSKENIDIHQLLAITIVTRMADNGNNQRSSVIYPKKKQQIAGCSPPTSPIAKQDDNNTIFDNLLTSKNDEDLQNMLNGNISEVSTDTKSFKEKLIMFEKLGK